MARVNVKDLVHRLAGLTDPPEKIAGGAALGMFLGVLPGTGPIAALAVALVLKQNRTAALLVGTAANFLAVPIVVAAFAAAAFEVRHGGWTAIWHALLATGGWTVAGFLVGATVTSILTYGLTLAAVKAYRRKRARGAFSGGPLAEP